MLNNLKVLPFVLIMFLTLSCNHSPKIQEAKENKKTTDSTVVTAVNTYTDDLVSFISGVHNPKNGCFAKIDSTLKWTSYRRELDSMFSRADTFRFAKMKVWSDSELVKNQNVKTVFYPFSGPDFINANIFYPNADKYIMVAMEPIGVLPDVCNMHPDSVNSYLNKINYSLRDIFKRSYFITKRMDTDLRKTKVNGALPLISLFIKRTGHQIVSIQKIGIDTLGKLIITDSLKNKQFVPGVRIDFRSSSTDRIQSVYYFRTDISDKGLAKNPGFKIYISELPQSFTYLKAASYLMHSTNFKDIRSVIFSISTTILQDDSGIAYRFFDNTRWDIRLYGKYVKPKTEFSYISEPDLEKAYKTSVFKSLPYSLGYNWGYDHSNMLYAMRKPDL